MRDAVLLNSAASLVAFEGPSAELENGIGAALDRAGRAIDSGAAAAMLDRWVTFSATVPR